MTCLVYPEGAQNEDGADEPFCERHLMYGHGTAHEMSNGLYRIHDRGGRYVDSTDDIHRL